MTVRPTPVAAAPGVATAVAHANIALIKYWGKADERLILPRTSSVSLTLDDLHTVTTVRFVDDGAEAGTGDHAVLDGQPLNGQPLRRISDFLDIVRRRAGITAAADVVTRNTVPTAAGLASSASGFAALAGAAAAAAGLELDDRDLSRLARRGSGSASRSVFGGLAIWHAGHDDESSYAEPLQSDLDLAIVVLVIDSGRKAVSSREAMRRTVETSAEYEPWVRRSHDDLDEALDAIAQADLSRLGETSEANAFGMHATMLGAEPRVQYLNASSIEALRAVREARAAGLPAWATMDAGANVKVLTSGSAGEQVRSWLRRRLEPTVPGLQTVVARSGPALSVWPGEIGAPGASAGSQTAAVGSDATNHAGGL
ncbi:diphosphomevalonate decarboxylase [Pseudoclavibacter sp. 13-3]|uniref:diphosphomevalonate decarboxylase n=1 Tax=Pseudoclavibacter sp. 13-3 TaxID=2901228 RepID=UPI001E2D3D42|nr:diphosphomevalonate decarboxylase [Pseudoclavibacter sp. 13-3]